MNNRTLTFHLLFALMLSAVVGSAQDLPTVSVRVTESICSEYTLKPGGFIFSRTGNLDEKGIILITLVGSSNAVENDIADPGIDYYVNLTEIIPQPEAKSRSSQLEYHSNIVGILEISAGSDQLFMQVIPIFDELVEQSEKIIIRINEAPELYTIAGDPETQFTIKDRNYENWKEYYLDETATAVDDADDDGISNLLEYSLVTDPTNGGGETLIDSYVSEENGIKRLGIKFRRLKGLADIHYSLEKFSNGLWVPSAHDEKILLDREDGTEEVAFFEVVAASEACAPMIRLKITEFSL